MPDQTGQDRPQALPAGVPLPTVLDEVCGLLEAVTNRLQDASFREGRISEAVETWLRLAQDESLSDAARATYLDCAETVTDIYR